jgi:hypothetical protein
MHLEDHDFSVRGSVLRHGHKIAVELGHQKRRRRKWTRRNLPEQFVAIRRTCW